jgi:lysophospholipase L1-like esterase
MNDQRTGQWEQWEWGAVIVVALLAGGCAGDEGTTTAHGADMTSPAPSADEDAGGSASGPAPGGGDPGSVAPPSPGGVSPGAGGSGGDVDAGGEIACAKGLVKPKQVVMLGDSYLDPGWSDTSLDFYAFAQQAGALGANETYRHYYLGGASLVGGMGQFNIPYQYEQMAMIDDPDIEAIIMDGGGNDVLISDRSCLTQAPPQNQTCVKTVDDAIAKAKEELGKMGANGVKNVLYFFYPHLDSTKSDGLLVGGATAVNETLDYAYPLVRAACEGSVAPKCFFVDTRPAFEGHTDEYIKSDRVHPSPAGAAVLAGLLWAAMAEHCIAQ